ncbi:MAG: hypothetical protein QM811_11830 [Pirellulales bacterium]
MRLLRKLLPRFSLRVLLVVVGVSALLASWYAREVAWHRARRRELAKLDVPLDPLHGPFRFRPMLAAGAPDSPWLRRVVGDDYSRPVQQIQVQIDHDPLYESDPAALRRLREDPAR